MGKIFSIKLSKKTWLILTLVYVLILVAVKFLNLRGLPRDLLVTPNPYNWKPYVDAVQWSALWYVYIINLLIMIPFGFITKMTKTNNLLCGIIIVGVCFCLDFFQPLFGTGVFDITTVIINIVGCVLGVIVAVFYKRKVKRTKSNLLDA